MKMFVWVVTLWVTDPGSGETVIKEMKYYESLRDCYQAAEIITSNMQDIKGFQQAVCLRTNKELL